MLTNCQIWGSTADAADTPRTEYGNLVSHGLTMTPRGECAMHRGVPGLY